jgi:hypothetical protein
MKLGFTSKESGEPFSKNTSSDSDNSYAAAYIDYDTWTMEEDAGNKFSDEATAKGTSGIVTDETFTKTEATSTYISDYNSQRTTTTGTPSCATTTGAANPLDLLKWNPAASNRPTKFLNASNVSQFVPCELYLDFVPPELAESLLARLMEDAERCWEFQRFIINEKGKALQSWTSVRKYLCSVWRSSLQRSIPTTAQPFMGPPVPSGILTRVCTPMFYLTRPKSNKLKKWYRSLLKGDEGNVILLPKAWELRVVVGRECGWSDAITREAGRAIYVLQMSIGMRRKSLDFTLMW